ncbi:uncharacterized protein [Patagioenas fasciata]|uniref:uncharacterized protein n=1 Tax=Patagioenas fasciata TaxID=372321 RepID=UPI003A99B0AD
MGNTASVEEKITVRSILQLAGRTGRILEKDAVERLSLFAQRKGCVRSTDEFFSPGTWEDIGTELWEAVTRGSREACDLAGPWREVRQLMQEVSEEPELCAVPSEPPAASCPSSENSEESTPLVCPVSDLEFWGGEQILPSAPVEPLPGSDDEWQQPASFNKPGQVNPADVPLPEDPMEHQDGASQNRPDFQEESHVQSLKDLLRRQESQMQEVLEAMKRLDGGNSKTSRLIAYKKASDAIKDGLEAIGRECEKRGKQEREGVELDLAPEELRIKREQIQKWARQCVEDGMWSVREADEYLRVRYGKGLETGLVDRFANMRRLTDPQGNTRELYSSDNNDNLGAAPVHQGRDIPRDHSYNAGQRWQGVIRDATIEGIMSPGSITAMPVHIDNRGQRQWSPFDWKTVKQLQSAVMQYGMDNKHVMQLINSFFKGQVLTQTDIRALIELLLPPTGYLLFLDTWQGKVELAVLENVRLPADDPLRLASMDQLLGRGQYADGATQAALHPRILQQTQGLALAAVKELPNRGNPVPPYSTIEWDPGEPYMTFVDRLKEVIDASPNVTPEAKAAVGKDLAMMNANTQCQQILAGLGKTASLAEMVEACTQVPIMQQEVEKAKIHAQAHAAALAAARKPAMKGGSPSSCGLACFTCKQTGHIKRNCPQYA